MINIYISRHVEAMLLISKSKRISVTAFDLNRN